jgi:hypothetical protein
MTRGTNHQYVDEIVNRFIASDPEEFSDSTTQGELRATIRIALEVGAYLDAQEAPSVAEELQWIVSSIRAGLDSAWALWDIYSLSEESVGEIPLRFFASSSEVKQAFREGLCVLDAEECSVEHRLRALLELVKLELVLLAAGFGTVARRTALQSKE